MPTNKTISEWIKFEEGMPVQVTFKTSPSAVKGKEKETDYGKKVYYYHFVDGNRALSASEALQAKLQEYGAGDSVVITFLEKRWIVTSSGERKVAEVKTAVNDAEVIALLKSLHEKVDKLLPKEANKETGTNAGVTTNTLTAEEDLGF